MSAPSLSHEYFEPLLGTAFSLIDEDATSIALDLVEVQPLRAYGPADRPPFSLLFRSQGERVLPQRLYRLRHGMTGEVQIFLVPIAKDAGGVTYEAAFN